MPKDSKAEWWQQTETVAALAVGVLLFVALIPLMVSADMTAFGAPLSLFTAVIVVPVATVITLLVVSRTQERLDSRHKTPRV